MLVIWARMEICRLWAEERADWRSPTMAGEGRAVTSSWRMLWEMVMMSVVITPEEREAVSWEISRAKLTPTEEPACSVVVSART